MDNNLSWSFGQVWNKSLEERPERPLVVRNHIWASEIGGSYLDRYLKMNGIPPTNPPNARSLRKFEAGNLIEWVAGMVLKRAGIYKETQEHLAYKYPDLLEVTGKLDFLAGGDVDWNQARQEIDNLELPEFFSRATTSIVDYLSTKYPQALNEILLEIKSCSSFMFDKYSITGADPRHRAQLFHYLKAKDRTEGHIVYISKDDLRMIEFGVSNPSETEEFYKKDIETMTTFINNKVQPDLEKPIAFDGVRFSANWKVGYSQYLTMLYGYESQAEFDNTFKPQVVGWNSTLKRAIQAAKGDLTPTGKPITLTPLNLQRIEEIKVQFPNFDEIVNQVKNSGVDPEKGEEE